ncbi:hypothetical protein [Aquimarina rhabdastrellae]
MIKPYNVASFLLKVILVLLTGGILQSCKSYVQYKPIKKDQRDILKNWLITRKNISVKDEQEDTLYITLVDTDSIQYYLDHRKRFPATIEEKDSLFFYDNFFNKTLISYKKYNPNKRKEKKRGIVIVDKEEFFSNKKVNKISYPLFSQDGKKAILYGMTIHAVSVIISYEKENKKWTPKRVFTFF